MLGRIAAIRANITNGGTNVGEYLSRSMRCRDPALHERRGAVKPRSSPWRPAMGCVETSANREPSEIVWFCSAQDKLTRSSG